MLDIVRQRRPQTSYRSDEIIWQPQPGPQTALLSCPVREIFFGGARGGGKTDGAIGHFVKHAQEHGKDASGIFIRRTYKELEEVIHRAQELLVSVATWKADRAIFVFANGARLKMRYLEKDTDAGRYQGHQYTWMCIEEAGNFPNVTPLDTLRATLRSSQGIPTWLLLTGNPGGVGHNWLKSRYIDPAPPMTPFSTRVEVGGRSTDVRRVFIPSKVSDNKILLENDPGYIGRIIEACEGQDWLVKAWLDGNWNIVAGGAFDDVWDITRHVILPFRIPSDWPIYRSFDWGSSKPFSVGWWVVADGDYLDMQNGKQWAPYPGSYIRVGELYGCVDGEPNKGIRVGPDEIARQILRYEVMRGWRNIRMSIADSSIFGSEHGKSIAEIMLDEGIEWFPADKKPGSRKAGYQIVRKLLRAVNGASTKSLRYVTRNDRPEDPGLYAVNTCRDYIRTMPSLPRNPKDLDDVDTAAEDHIYDEVRYLVTADLSGVQVRKLIGL